MTEDATLPSPPSPPNTPADPPGSAEPTPPPPYRPNYWFLVIVAVVSLGLDLGTKMWAKARLEDVRPFPNHRTKSLEVIHDHLTLVFADNPGGAWGLLGNQPEWIRRPFFIIISVLAIGFIVSLYRRLTPQQTALKWGLPLVLGGALGNLVNRIQYNSVIDFIDVRAEWIRSVQGLFSKTPTDHWPTFNVADIAICVGVGLMAIDMFTSRKAPKKSEEQPAETPPEKLPEKPAETPPEKAPEGDATVKSG